MSDSSLRESLAAKQDRQRERRREQIERWVAFIKEHPPADWGPQQNALVDSQLAGARETDLDVEHYRRVRRTAGHRAQTEDG